MSFRLWERIRDWLLLFLLLALALGTMLAQNRPLVRAMRASALESTAWLESRISWMGGYFRALDENEMLREENIVLASEVARAREAMIENDRLERLLTFRDSTRFNVLPARVVAKDLTRQQNFLTLDVGSNDSVKVGMAVVDERGVLGKIVLVSPHYAIAMPYLNTDFRLPSKVQPHQASGIVRWEGTHRDRLLMENVVKTVPVQPGQLVVTSGYSAVFPAGYPVGTVDSVAARPGRNELLIYLRPAAPLQSAEHAFVLLQLPDPERTTLETSFLSNAR